MDIKKRTRMPNLKFKSPLSISHRFSIRPFAVSTLLHFLCIPFLAMSPLLVLLGHVSAYFSLSNLPAWSTYAVSNSVQDLTSGDVNLVQEIWLEIRVVFPDSVPVLLKTGMRRPNLQLSQQFDFIYHRFIDVTAEQERPEETGELVDIDNQGILLHQAL